MITMIMLLLALLLPLLFLASHGSARLFSYHWDTTCTRTVAVTPIVQGSCKEKIFSNHGNTCASIAIERKAKPINRSKVTAG